MDSIRAVGGGGTCTRRHTSSENHFDRVEAPFNWDRQPLGSDLFLHTPINTPKLIET